MHNYQSKILLVLEGGYNCDEISDTSISLLKILKGEFFPN